MKKTNGFTLVEALLAMTIVIFVVVGILSGFTQQMVTNRFAGAKNVAITLAESKLEDYLKFPASQMPADQRGLRGGERQAPGRLPPPIPTWTTSTGAPPTITPVGRLPHHEHRCR